MEDRTKPLQRCLNLLVSCLAVVLFLPSLPVQEQEADLSKAKASIQRLRQLPSAVAGVQSTLQAANFGPFTKSGNCENFYWELTYNFREIRNDLQGRYKLVGDRSKAFESAYSPVKSWLVVTLPAFADRFDTTSQQLLTYSQQSRTGTPEQVKAATAGMEQSIGATVGEVKEAETGLQGAFIGLTKFNQEMLASLQGVNDVHLDWPDSATYNYGSPTRGGGRPYMTLRERLKFYMDRGMAGYTDYMPRNGISVVYARYKGGRINGPWPQCAQDQQWRAWDEAKETARGEVNKVAAASREFGVATAGSDSSVPDILARIVEIQRRYESVLARLQKAQTTPAGAIQELHINTARTAVRNLANYARGELQ